jgi:hypothetical protein
MASCCLKKKMASFTCVYMWYLTIMRVTSEWFEVVMMAHTVCN